MSPDHRDRRRFERRSIDLRVRVFAKIAGRSEVSYGRGHDLGEAGMAIYVPLELKVGQEIQVEFEAALVHVKFGVRGLVRNIHSYRYGVEFLQLSPQELKELRRLLNVIALTASGSGPAT